MSSLLALFSLFFVLCLVAVSAQEVFDAQENLQVDSEALIKSFGGITDYGERQARQKKKKKKNGNHNGSDEQSGEHRGSGEGHKNPNKQTHGAPHPATCGKKFQYVSDGRGWQGTMKLKNININHDNYLEVDFHLPQGLHQDVSSEKHTRTHSSTQHLLTSSELPGKN